MSYILIKLTKFTGKSKGTKEGKIRKQNKLRWNKENSQGYYSSISFLCTIYIDNQANKLVFELYSEGCNCEPSLIKNQIIPRSLSKYYSKKSVYFDSIKKGTYWQSIHKVIKIYSRTWKRILFVAYILRDRFYTTQWRRNYTANQVNPWAPFTTRRTAADRAWWVGEKSCIAYIIFLMDSVGHHCIWGQ